MSSSDAVNGDQAGAPVSEPKSEVIDQTAEVNQAPAAAATEQAPAAAATEQAPNQAPPVVVSESTAAPAAPVVSVPEEAITAMYETIIAIAKLFNNVDPKEVFNALTSKGVPDFEELKKAFTTQILVDAEKQRIALLLLKTDGSDLGNPTFAKFLKLVPTPAPAPVAPDVSEQSASPAPVANVSDDAAVTPAAAIESAGSKPDESIDSNASAPAPAPAPNLSGGSKKKRSQTKRKNGHHHHISRNRKARA